MMNKLTDEEKKQGKDIVYLRKHQCTISIDNHLYNNGEKEGEIAYCNAIVTFRDFSSYAISFEEICFVGIGDCWSSAISDAFAVSNEAQAFIYAVQQYRFQIACSVCGKNLPYGDELKYKEAQAKFLEFIIPELSGYLWGRAAILDRHRLWGKDKDKQEWVGLSGWGLDLSIKYPRVYCPTCCTENLEWTRRNIIKQFENLGIGL